MWVTDVIGRREKVRFKDWKVTRESDERMCAGREFQLLGEDTQKAREAKDNLTQEGTARR